MVPGMAINDLYIYNANAVRLLCFTGSPTYTGYIITLAFNRLVMTIKQVSQNQITDRISLGIFTRDGFHAYYAVSVYSYFLKIDSAQLFVSNPLLEKGMLMTTNFADSCYYPGLSTGISPSTTVINFIDLGTKMIDKNGVISLLTNVPTSVVGLIEITV